MSLHDGPILTYGDLDGRLVHISEVARGMECGCACSACGVPLIARQGDVVCHHFAHVSGADCATAIETALHRAGKQAIIDARRIRLPEVVVYFPLSCKEPWVISPEAMMKIESAVLERRDGTLIPDLTVETGGRRLFIEIRVTHPVGAEKTEKLRALGVDALEIDLSGLLRGASPEEIYDAAVESVALKQWLSSRSHQARLDLNARSHFLAATTSPMGPGGVRLRLPFALVDDCPRHIEPYASACQARSPRYVGRMLTGRERTPFAPRYLTPSQQLGFRTGNHARAEQDCRYCDFNAGDRVHDAGGARSGVWCLGYTGIVTYEHLQEAKKNQPTQPHTTPPR